MARVLMVIAGVVIAVPLLLLLFGLAGWTGLILGFLAIGAVGMFFAAYIGLLVLPTLASVAFTIVILLGLLGIGIISVNRWAAKPPSGVTSPPRQAVPATFSWVKKTQYKAPPDRWSDERPTPSGVFRLVPEEGEQAETLYSNGVYHLLDSSKQVDRRSDVLGPKFQIRGIGKEATVFVYVAER